jgi:hypothetical protein
VRGLLEIYSRNTAMDQFDFLSNAFLFVHQFNNTTKEIKITYKGIMIRKSGGDAYSKASN